MRTALSMALGLTLVFALALTASAEEKKKGKEVTLKGTLVCGKCKLKETDACANVLQVKDGDKTVSYYLKDKGKAEKYHKEICTNDGKEATVKGTVTEKDGKRWVSNAKVE